MECPQRILLVQLQQLGDVVLSAALLEDLRGACPSATIDFLTGPRPGELVRGNPHVSQLLVYDRQHPWQMIRRIRANRYQWVIDVQSSPRTAPLTLLSGAGRRVGWAIRGPWRFVYTDRIPRRPRDEYVIRQRQRLLELLGVPIRPRLPKIFLTPEERAAGIAELQAVAPRGGPRVGLVLSARGGGKVWPPDRFAQLVAGLAAEGIVPVVIGTGGDAEAVARCLTLAPAAVHASVPALRPFAAFLGALDALVCGDTGPAHIAMAVGTPAVVLFGATDPRHWTPAVETIRSVQSPRAGCTACAADVGQTSTSHTCMSEIEVGDVLAAARELLGATFQRHRAP